MVFCYETGGYEEIANALRILNWARAQATDREAVTFRPFVKRGRARSRRRGKERLLKPSLLRPALLPRLIVGGSGLLGVRLKPGVVGDWRFQLAGPPIVAQEARGREIEPQVARLLEFLLTTAKDSAPSASSHQVHQQLRSVIDGGADLPAGAIIDLQAATLDVLDPTAEASAAEDEESA